MENSTSYNIINKPCFLSLGSNSSDQIALLSLAKAAVIRDIGPILKESNTYKTSAWGYENQNDFLNEVILIDAQNYTAEFLLKKLQLIENQLGRVRTSNQFGPRTIDIDILIFGDESISTTTLSIPHPRMLNRKFVLIPLAEIAAQFKIPKEDISVEKALLNCTDTGLVTLFSPAK